MKQKNVSEIEEVSINFIGFNTMVLFIFIIWWYNVISATIFGNYSLSGEKQMFEIFIYTIGSFAIPLLYTFYILAHVQYSKIKKQSLYFKLIGLAWLPALILLITICYNLATVDNRVYFE
ncbi:hypothetical protein D0809_21405 [Flavobacterium circumlabens]|uniref:Uncharacterized protein n=1 Tax=Flavobacterium circumlabens TaxID=2133765 RepID=A0A4Y7U8Q1_9FLAO|nr:hypothetical protein [Flavobacterium circumlabens]TCN61259.1 hypothetical protein EV142_101847 [Flavobacterium circumlabens]TEB42132.1 hypothetical protein D0809_21405 [Flavobacterium circumlabens]